MLLVLFFDSVTLFVLIGVVSGSMTALIRDRSVVSFLCLVTGLSLVFVCRLAVDVSLI